MPLLRLSQELCISLPPEVIEELGVGPGDEIQLTRVEEGYLLGRPPVSSSVPTLKESVHRKNLQASIQCIKGIGPKIAAVLEKKGISTVEDALYLLPHRYEDRREIRPISKARPGYTEIFAAEVVTATTITGRGGRRYFEAVVKDQTGSLTLKWFHFNPAFMAKAWQPGRKGIFTGEVSQFGYQREIHHPEVEWIPKGEDPLAFLSRDSATFGRIVPVYPLTEGVQQRTMRVMMKSIVETFSGDIIDTLPLSVRRHQDIRPVAEALRGVHLPGPDDDMDTLNGHASHHHRSIVFEELFFLELGLALRRRGVTLESGISFTVTHRYTKELSRLLPFQLTDAQRRVLSEIKNDMMSPHPMNRLVQGDVGSGKTLIALMSALIAVENGYQVAIMAPTEILAEQHYLNVHSWCDNLGITVTLLTSGMKNSTKSDALAAISTGKTMIAIGTHAMIQEKVDFHRLGLGIIDEQHRFGVLQRNLLKKKGATPDILYMTATPIPRTLAMTVFGDLSISVVDQLPPGRTPVDTRVYFESRRNVVYDLIRDEIKAGRQGYIICPLVEESEKSELKAATQMAENLSTKIFPELQVGLLHGKMKPEEKEATMRLFKDKKIDILVATTVIEVGVDVPNASMIVIEHAERFGLSQLHQLRGRVGRGSAASRCILLAGDKISDDAEKRLRVVTSTNDGFRIAEADLEIRGPGDFLGTRQSGLPDFRVANILRDARILEDARNEAFALVETDSALELPEHRQLRAELARRWEGRLELAGIG